MKLTPNKEESQWRSRLRLSGPLLANVAIIGFTIGMYRYGPARRLESENHTFICTPDAQVRLPNEHIRKWNPHNALWINLAFGHFSFAGAKSVDFAWDLIVGRGGQMVLVYFSYPLIRRTLLLAITRLPVHIPLFTSLAFDGVSFPTLWTLVRGRRKFVAMSDELETRSTGEQRIDYYTDAYNLGTFWILPLVTYLLAFPTLMSIMTGYQAGLTPYFRLLNGDLIQPHFLGVPDILVLDGPRLGLPASTVPPQDWNEALHDYKHTWTNFSQTVCFIAYVNGIYGGPAYSVDQDCIARLEASGTTRIPITPVKTAFVNNAYTNHGKSCSFTAILTTDSWISMNSNITIANQTWNLRHSRNETLAYQRHNDSFDASPPLSIAVGGHAPRMENAYVPNNARGERYWTIGDEFLSTTYLTKTSQCQPSSTYVWGFSFLLLFVTCILTAVFTTMLSILYLDTYCYSPADRIEQSVSVYHDALVLVRHLRRMFSEGEEEGLSAREMEERVKESAVRMEGEVVEMLSRSEQGWIRRRVREEVVIDEMSDGGEKGMRECVDEV